MTNKTQKSKEIREGWVQFGTLCCGTGWDEADLKNPQIIVEDVFASSHPGSYHLDTLAEEDSTSIHQNGGNPSNFHGGPLFRCHLRTLYRSCFTRGRCGRTHRPGGR